MTDQNGRGRGRGGGALPTEVPGLDRVLNGGFARGGLYVVTGPPGAGKTPLGNQIAYAQAASGSVAVSATVLAETHELMLAHLTGFGFIAPEEVARRVHYLSLYDELDGNGLPGALALLRRLVREQRATLLVIEGASLFADFSESADEFRRFTSELHAQLAALGCTSLLLIDGDAEGRLAIGYQVDGVAALTIGIGPRGVEVAKTVESAEAVLPGVARLVASGGYQDGPRSFSIPPEGNRRP